MLPYRLRELIDQPGHTLLPHRALDVGQEARLGGSRPAALEEDLQAVFLDDRQELSQRGAGPLGVPSAAGWKPALRRRGLRAIT
jgi:hypothetical protein